MLLAEVLVYLFVYLFIMRFTHISNRYVFLPFFVCFAFLNLGFCLILSR